MTQTNPFSRPPQPGQAPAPNQPADEFELMRRRLKLRGATRKDESGRQVARQQAALGNLPSGAALKLQQRAAQEAEMQTSQELQDVNVLESQTRRAEREAEAQRAFGREGLRSQESIARERIAGERGIQELRGAQELEKQELVGAQRLSEIEAAGLNDIEVQRMRGASAKEISQMEINARETEARLIEGGRNARFARELSQNLTIAQWDKQLRSRKIDLEQEIFDNSKTEFQQQMDLDKAVTGLNSIEPLKFYNFTPEEIRDVLSNMGLPDNIANGIYEGLRTTPQPAAGPPGRGMSRDVERGGEGDAAEAAGFGGGFGGEASSGPGLV